MAGGLSRRALALAAALLCATFATATAGLASSSQPTRSVSSLNSLERGVLADINAFRAQHHLVPLRLSTALTTAAREHTQQMAADGYFAHESADGSAFWKRIQLYYASHPWHYWSVGENLLWSSPDVDAHSALQDWVNSPEHRANLLTPNWREIGISAVHVIAAPGTYNGLDVTIVTTDFGVRR